MKNVVLLDGAVGTSLWEMTDNKVPVWRYNFENPEIVTRLHRQYVDAGAQIILANTFGANRGAVSRTNYNVEDVVREGVRLAKAAADGRAQVALSAGPLSALLEPYGDLTHKDARDMYAQQIGAGMAEKPDVIMLQTFMDVEMMRIALGVARGYDVPVYCTMSFDKNGRTMMGNSVTDMIERLSDLRPDAVGLNCSIGPELALPVIKTFLENTDLPVMYKPNAGTPILSASGEAQPSFDIETFVNDVLPAVDMGVSFIGGCCGTNAAYITRLAQRLAQVR